MYVGALIGHPSLPGCLIGRLVFPDEVRAHHNESSTRRQVGNYPSLPQGWSDPLA